MNKQFHNFICIQFKIGANKMHVLEIKIGVKSNLFFEPTLYLYFIIVLYNLYYTCPSQATKKPTYEQKLSLTDLYAPT